MLRRLILFAGIALSVNSVYAGRNDLLPRPKAAVFSNGNFKLNKGISIEAPTLPADEPQINSELRKLISSYGGTITSNSKYKIAVIIDKTIKGDESYTLTVEKKLIEINASSARGAYWGIQTLWQLAENNGSAIDCCVIGDKPAFDIRGYMHDVGRDFIEFDELLHEIEKLSRYKINTFHWHLTDNQGWRLESKIYPQLNENKAFSRKPGKYYTIEQAKRLVQFAHQHGVEVIPEIDMPGHSEAFRNAMGHSMLTPQGLAEMKQIMAEAASTFSGTPWMHIGTDEVRQPDLGTIDWTEFVPEMVKHLRSLGKKVVSWNPGYKYAPGEIDMTQMWSYRGAITPGVPAIDCRYHYANHFDSYSDVVSLYSATIANQEAGSHQYAGSIIGFWNDRMLESDADIVKQNSFYPVMLALAERAWLGGGKGYFDKIGVTIGADDKDFADWERRFLQQKTSYLKDEPISYVKQSNIRWHITKPVDNGGDLSRDFDFASLDTAYTASGAAVYLRHVWGSTMPSVIPNPQPNSTVYAYTDVFSKTDQTVGLVFETQNYSRSEMDLAAPQGKWDYRESKIWINGIAINPPVWINTHSIPTNEISLKNENAAARKPIPVTLNKGWNRILIKLPVGEFKSTKETRLVKWMFTCTLTNADGTRQADDIIYK
jgi:hypothetical protein